MDDHLTASRAFAKAIRSDALRMVHRANSSHIGTCLSMADLLAVLYTRTLKLDPAQPGWSERDRLILSKGHGAAILYAALAQRGFFPTRELESFSQDGSLLTGHVNHHVPGIDFSTGSLGHGLSVACGMAVAGKRAGASWRVFAILSDGELDEGSTWEPILFAPQHHLDNLTAIVDYNKIQSFGTVAEVLDLHPLAEKWRACRWAVREVDGHDHAQVTAALDSLPFKPGAPSVLIAHTIKGKGVSYMENQLAWHYKAPDSEQLAQALAEVEAAP
mgnify:CR=1 FL=1